MESILSNENNPKYNKMKPVIKIGIAYHKQCTFYESDMFIPIQVGAARSNSDFGIQKDSDGDNISFANAYCSEMSASYWLWKNCDADYKGLFHYRRFLSFRKQCPMKRWKGMLLYITTKFVSPFIKDSWIKYFAYPNISVTEIQVGEVLKEFENDVYQDIQKNNIDCYSSGYMYHSTYTVKTHLQRAIGYWHSEKIKDIVKTQFPEFNKYFQLTLSDNKFVGYNMIVAKDKIYDDYCKTIFNILAIYHEYMNENIPDNIKNNALLRDYGYIAELLTDSYLRKIETEGKKVKHLGVISADIELGGMSYRKKTLLKLIIDKLR